MNKATDTNKDECGQETALSTKTYVRTTTVSAGALERLRAKKRTPTADELYEGLRRGERAMLSRAITLLESTLPAHQQMARGLVERCLPHSGNSIRLGITGVPGAGKSTVIEALGKMLTEKGHHVAVLAIDPSSERTGGSILGDKTRMEELSRDPQAFIRPSPSGGSLGGVARQTRETITLCEAAGYDVVIVETVGVGQSEVAAHSMVDFFLLLQITGGGDELQGIKRGIMEMADMIAINKCELDRERAELTAQQLRNALHLFPTPESGWQVPVALCSAYSHEGITELWGTVERYVEQTKTDGYFYRHRREQDLRIMTEAVEHRLLSRFYSTPGIDSRLQQLKTDILDGRLSPYAAADLLIGE